MASKTNVDMEAELWKRLCGMLIDGGLIQQADIDAHLYQNQNTPAAQLLRTLRSWGSVRFRQGVALCEKLDEASEPESSTDWRRY